MTDSTLVEENNKALFRRWFTEVWNEGNFDVAEEIVGDDIVLHGASGQPLGHGREGMVSLVRSWRTAFPDGHMSIGDLLAEGDMAVARVIWQGTHTGPFMGIPPTGRRVTIIGFGFDRVRNGQFVEGWGDVDLLGALQQIGAVPAFANREAYGWAPLSDEEINASALSAPPAPRSPGSVEENRDLARRFFEALNDWDLEAFREVVDPETYVERNPFLGPLTFDEAVQMYSMTRQIIPDLRITLEPQVQVAEGDRIGSRGTLRGAHTAVDLFGAPPDGRIVEWTGNDILRVADGRIVERWLCADIYRFMLTMGVPALEQLQLPLG
jgi:steroid delta-isomerase-like uncharacterized protein